MDVHAVHPAGCPSCALYPPERACLEHTCPDCGSIVHGEVNERGELTHTCVTWARSAVLAEGDFFCLSPVELPTGGWLVTSPPGGYSDGTLVLYVNSPYPPVTGTLNLRPDQRVILTDGMSYADDDVAALRARARAES